MGKRDDDARAMAEAASIEAFLDAHLPPGEAGFVGWTRAAAAAAVAAPEPLSASPAELRALLARWAREPSSALLRAIADVVVRTRAGADAPGARPTLGPVDIAGAALAGVGNGWRADAELAIASARGVCGDEHALAALRSAIAGTMEPVASSESIVPRPPRTPATVPPGMTRLPAGWRPGGGFDAELGRGRTGVSATRDWSPLRASMEPFALALERSLGARAQDVVLERTRAHAHAASLRLELAGPDHVRVRLDRDPRGSSEVSILVFGDGTEVLFSDLCAAVDAALVEAGQSAGRAEAPATATHGLAVHVADARQSVTSVLRGRPVLPSGFRWLGDDAVGACSLARSFVELERMADALEQALELPGAVSLSLRGRVPHLRAQVLLGGTLGATLDGHGAEVRVRASTHASVATITRALWAAMTAPASEHDRP